MFRRTLIALSCLLTATQLFAVTADPVSLTISQRDGMALTIHLFGDEHMHGWLTTDGVPVLQDASGAWVYPVIHRGALQAGALLAHDPEARSWSERLYVDTHKDELLSFQRECWYAASSKADVHRRARRAKTLGTPTTYIGQKKGLVLLVNFKDTQMSEAGTHEEFNNMFNQTGYNHFDHIGSVHDYFFSQSYSLFDLTFDVIGPLTLSQNLAYYGSNQIDKGNDRHPAEMIAEACRAADRYVNYADYDWDGDGEVEQVFVIYAGYGEHAGAPTYTIWPHESNLASRAAAADGTGPITLDGVRIDTYACSCELRGRYGTSLNGIGTACHEFSHCLGLPDFYDISYTGGFGMSYWDLMSSGSQCGPNSNGEVPRGFTAYERWFAGWLQLRPITESCHIDDLTNLGLMPVAYLVANPDAPNEYFILENHQNRGWFSYAGDATECHGLMVTHVDYDSNAWSQNRVNNNNRHQRMCIVPADNDFGTKNSSNRYYPTETELRGDLFPGSHSVTALTPTSHQQVGGLFYQPDETASPPLCFALTDITETSGLLSFNVIMNNDLPAPVATEATINSHDSFTANWTLVPQAESYTLELIRVLSQKPLRTTTERFEGLTGNNLTLTDITESILRYHVRSHRQDYASEWSNYIEVRLSGNGIDSPNTDKTNATQTEYFDLSGRPIPASQLRRSTIYLQRQGKRIRKVKNEK